MEPDAIVSRSGGRRYALADIVMLERRELDKAKTVAVGVAVGVAAFFAVIWLLYSTSGFNPHL